MPPPRPRVRRDLPRYVSWSELHGQFRARARDPVTRRRRSLGLYREVAAAADAVRRFLRGTTPSPAPDAPS